MRQLLSRRDIRRAVRQLAVCIDRDYTGRDLHILCVLKGAFVFCADLVRELSTPCTVDFVRLASYGASTTSSRSVTEVLPRRDPLAGRDVLVVEEVVDTGLTLASLLEDLRREAPATLAVCALIDKRGRREVEVPIDYCGVSIATGFLVGYGLDLDDRLRSLPAIHELEGDTPRPVRKERAMSVWTCPTCGFEKDARCKPKKCPDCDKAVDFAKKGDAPAPAVKASKPAAAKTAKPAAKAVKAAPAKVAKPAAKAAKAPAKKAKPAAKAAKPVAKASRPAAKTAKPAAKAAKPAVAKAGKPAKKK